MIGRGSQANGIGKRVLRTSVREIAGFSGPIPGGHQGFPRSGGRHTVSLGRDWKFGALQ